MDTMFSPRPWFGEPKNFTRDDVYPWVSQLPNTHKIFCAFWCNWIYTPDLPDGFDFYIFSYHIENVNLEWLEQQREKVHGKFIVLFPGQSYDYQIPNTIFISYIDWHNDIEKILSWNGPGSSNPDKKFKYSAVCNRVTQSKIWITTKLLEVASSESLILLNNQVNKKNVHNWERTGNSVLDALTDTYIQKYQDLKITDGFDSVRDNKQIINANPWQPQYTETALHFTNGSFHYSYMIDKSQSYIYPGPDIDEKTLKCLVAGVPFIACGQFEIYKTLETLGLNFGYEFDTSWDNDSGNLSRFESICHLIDYLDNFSKEDITAMTAKATDYNREFILKKGFYARCESYKQQSIATVFDCL